MTKYIRYAFVFMAAVVAGCTMADSTPPPLAGPSEMALSLAITASPDVLSLDGASQTLIAVEARDHNGQPAANVPLRIEILADGQTIDFGSISARTLVTGSNGRATFTYTAPSFVGGPIPDLQLSVTPTGTDASAQIRRVVSVRLVPPGIIAGAPQAVFTFTPASPAAFTTVRFDGSQSTGGLGAVITSYVWDFGDGTSGTGRTATHQYSLAGTYSAKLTVTDSNGISNQSAGQAITVGAGDGPTAAFVYSPATPAVDESIFFNGSTSTAGQGHQIVRYDWSFGTGAARSGSTVTRSYDSAGAYSVVLTVTDEVGQKAQTTQTVTIADDDAPTAAFVFSPTSPAVNESIFFNGRTSTAAPGHRIVRYDWSFGTGASGSGATITRAYSTGGTYNVVLTVTDEIGHTGQVTQQVVVGAPQPIAAFTVSPTDPAPLTVVQFNGSGSTAPAGSTIDRYDWDFGDGSSARGLTVATTSHPYATANTFTIRLTVTDSLGRTATSTQTLTVAAPGSSGGPTASFTVSASPTRSVPVTFDASASTPATGAYTWDFGDAASPVAGVGVTSTHTYAVAGPYTVRLTVTVGTQSATSTRAIVVAP